MKVNRLALLIVMLLVATIAPMREADVSVAAQDPVQIMPAQVLDCRPAVILSIPFGGGVVYFQDTANCLNSAGSVYECALEVPPMSDPLTFRSVDFREVWNRSVAYDCDIFGTCLAQNEPTLVCRNIEPRNYGAD
jgi:hypothetical protein